MNGFYRPMGSFVDAMHSRDPTAWLALQSAAQNLVTRIGTFGCGLGQPIPEVSTFQLAYASAGGSWSELGVRANAPDGIYTPAVQACLAAVIGAAGLTDSSGQPLAAPPPCAAQLPNTPTPPPPNTTPTPPGSTTTTTSTTSTTTAPPPSGGGSAIASLVPPGSTVIVPAGTHPALPPPVAVSAPAPAPAPAATTVIVPAAGPGPVVAPGSQGPRFPQSPYGHPQSAIAPSYYGAGAPPASNGLMTLVLIGAALVVGYVLLEGGGFGGPSRREPEAPRTENPRQRRSRTSRERARRRARRMGRDARGRFVRS